MLDIITIIIYFGGTSGPTPYTSTQEHVFHEAGEDEASGSPICKALLLVFHL